MAVKLKMTSPTEVGAQAQPCIKGLNNIFFFKSICGLRALITQDKLYGDI